MRLNLSRVLRGLWLKLMISYALATALALSAGALVRVLIEEHQLRKWRAEGELTAVAWKIENWFNSFSSQIDGLQNADPLTLWLERQEEEFIAPRQRYLAPYLSYCLERSALEHGEQRRRLLLITDRTGIILAGTGEGNGWKGQTILDKIDRQLAERLTAAAKQPNGGNFCGPKGVCASEQGDFIMAPVLGRGQSRISEGPLIGTVIMKKIAIPPWRNLMLISASILLRGAGAIIVFAGLFGAISGWLLNRRLASRIDQIARTADAWSDGGFSSLANDGSADEIVQLSERLNSTARQLRDTFALRQQLAASEERNRLARDLHDTVKQQVFALSMQLAAAQARLEQEQSSRTVPNSSPGEIDQVRTHLGAAEKLANQAQQELVQVIRELKPVQPDPGWSSGLRDYVEEWSRRNGIAAEFHCDRLPPMPSEVQATILRIIQEACANIARHSLAREVKITLDGGMEDELLLTISDDGRGFDPLTVTPGMGLQNMRERAEAMFGGWFKIVSQTESGTRIEAGCKLSLSWPTNKDDR